MSDLHVQTKSCICPWSPGSVMVFSLKSYPRSHVWSHNMATPFRLLTTWPAGRMSICLSVQHSSQWGLVGGRGCWAGWCVTNTRTQHRYTDRQPAILSWLSTAEGNATQSWLSLSYLYQQKSATKLTLGKTIICMIFFSDFVGCGWRSFN